jgi:hypothetical protein
MNAHDGAMGAGRRGSLHEGFGVRRLPVAPAELPPPGPLTESAGGDELLRSAVDRARRLSEDLAEPFRSLAFSALLAHLLRDAPEDGGAARAAVEERTPPATDMPVAEFLALRRIDSHPDRVVAIAYYHYHRFDGQGVTTKDLLDGYVRARAKRPQNYPDVIASCVRKGYLVEGSRRDGMKTWVITRTGETHVEQDL